MLGLSSCYQIWLVVEQTAATEIGSAGLSILLIRARSWGSSLYGINLRVGLDDPCEFLSSHNILHETENVTFCLWHGSIHPSTPRQAVKNTQFLQQVSQSNTKAAAKPAVWGFNYGVGIFFFFFFFDNLSQIIIFMAEWCLAPFRRSPLREALQSGFVWYHQSRRASSLHTQKGKAANKDVWPWDKVAEIHTGGRESADSEGPLHDKLNVTAD